MEFSSFPLSVGEEDVNATEQRWVDQERSAEGDLWKRWADVFPCDLTKVETVSVQDE